MVRAKLIETPWLGAHQPHVAWWRRRRRASSTRRRGKPVLEFGARRTHPAAAVDAAYAAYLAGCAGDVEPGGARIATACPRTGTMDHFAVQAAEQPGESPAESERDVFAAFARAFPDDAILLVDTYDTERGIRHAVAATDGKLHRHPPRLQRHARDGGARARAARRARRAAREDLRLRRARRVARARARACADGFGVGENITCSPDAATGVGAVAKLVVNGYGKITMKLARGSGKATLPGELQVYRFADHDLVALADEAAPSGGRALLQPVWRGRAPVARAAVAGASRARYVRAQIDGAAAARCARSSRRRRAVAAGRLRRAGARDVEQLVEGGVRL